MKAIAGTISIKKGDLVVLRDGTRVIVTDTYWLDENDGPIIGEIYGDPSYRFKIEDVARKVTLREFTAIAGRRDFNCLKFTACVADYLSQVLMAEEALTTLVFALKGKIHKYRKEAWLGGYDGMELR